MERPEQSELTRTEAVAIGLVLVLGTVALCFIHALSVSF